MSETASLPPGYAVAFDHTRSPSYSAEPRGYEQRLAHVDRIHSQPRNALGDYVKQSKHGGVSLRLAEQEQGAELPEYGLGAVVEGEVLISKPDGVSSVEIKIEGMLHIKEIAEGGTVSHVLCLDRAVLWSKDNDHNSCPPSLSFSLPLPAKFSDGKDEYPLPPTYFAHLSGVPGFRANIDYSVKAVIHKGNTPLAKTHLFGLDKLALNTVSTPFVYHPRTSPAAPLPHILLCLPGGHGFVESPEWSGLESVMRSKVPGTQDIVAKLYLPRSRIFCMTQAIPFHLTFQSSSVSLAAFLPFGPSHVPNRQTTQIQLVRQTTVDVRNEVIMGTKTDMWRTDTIGQGTFMRAGDGADWVSYSGQIEISDLVKVGGFKAGGLFVKDFVVLSMTPSDSSKAPFRELRQVVPVRLTTDPWLKDGTGLGSAASRFSVPSNPDDYVDGLPVLHEAPR